MKRKIECEYYECDKYNYKKLENEKNIKQEQLISEAKTLLVRPNCLLRANCLTDTYTCMCHNIVTWGQCCRVLSPEKP